MPSRLARRRSRSRFARAPSAYSCPRRRAAVSLPMGQSTNPPRIWHPARRWFVFLSPTCHMAELKPRAPIRRFDIFAEYNRLKGRKEGMPAGRAKGYGLWLAKVVAAQKFGRMPRPSAEAREKEGKQKREPSEERAKHAWLDLSGVPQTD